MNPAQQILERIDYGALIQDADSRIIYANPAANRILGMEDGGIVGRATLDDTWDVIRPDGSPLPGPEHPAAVALRTGRPVRGEILGVWRPALEDRQWIIVDSVPELDEEGAVRNVVTVFRNIPGDNLPETALAEANRALEAAVVSRTAEMDATVQALKRSEANYRAVIRAMAEGIAIHGRTGEIEAANPAAERILGLTLDQMQGRHPRAQEWALTREDGSPLPPEEIPSEITRRTGRPCRDHMLRVRRGTGNVAWLSVNTSRIDTDDARPPYRVVATFTDITRERMARRAVEEGRDRLSHVTEMVPGVILENLVRPDGTEEFSFASAAASEVLGVSAAEIQADAASCWNALHPQDRKRVLVRRREAIQAGSPLDEECRRSGAPGGERWLRLRSTAPRATDEGHVFHFIVLDITEERAMMRVLQDAQRREGLGTLAAGIAHNFNNMLAAIIPSLELGILEGGEELRPILEDAMQAAQSASELVRQLMLLAGRAGDVAPEPFVVSDLVREVARICHRTFDRRFTVAVDIDPDAEALRVLGRRSGLHQALVNLALNARDAMANEPHPRLEIRLDRVDDQVRIQVRDNGTGIPPEVMARLGEPFFTTKAQGAGTGLGLASALSVARDMGGTLTWDSEEAEGACFTLSLPITRKDRPPPAGDPPRPGVSSTPEGRVLVVDDEPLVRGTIERMVARLGLEVVAVESGQAALDYVGTGTAPADLVLLDLSMPGISGVDVLQRLHALDPGLPVVVMSGYLPEGDDRLAQAVSVLQKPIRTADLRAVVDSLLAVDGAPGA